MDREEVQGLGLSAFQIKGLGEKKRIQQRRARWSDQRQEENLNVKFWKQNEESVSRRRAVSAMSNAMNSSKMGTEN